MSHATVITLEYPPVRGGVARYLGGLVDASGGEIGTVVVEQNHKLTGPGSVIPREFFWHGWPTWGPMIRVCLEQKKSKMLIVSHLLPVGTAVMIARWLGGAPYTVVCHGLDVRLAAARPWKKFLAGLVLRHAHMVVANSASTAKMVKRIVPTDPLILTPGVAQGLAMSREAAREHLGIAQDEELILGVGRLVKRKGFDLLLEATERLKDRERVRTVIVGDGPELANLKQLAEHMKHPVRFVTDAQDRDLEAWYAAADVFCGPSRESANDVEGFGIVYLEAAAHGLPVVATVTGGVAEAVMNGETGLLVPPDDLHALSDALRRLLENPAMRQNLGQNGLERALRDFRWEDRWKRLKKALK